ncbi:hypothetical protein B0H14DRAFT_3884498 [Mycena olivaceomarginata]|nr:hypothetical protein B0H14DRAFT_3884498 [Mycena olivaceomarginata]
MAVLPCTDRFNPYNVTTRTSLGQIYKLHPFRVFPSPHTDTPSLYIDPLPFSIVLGVFLFGIETLQTFNYYRRFPKDSNLLKAAVAFVWVLELGHTISALHALYLQTITFYGQPNHVLSPPLSEDITILFAGLIYTVVQTFFANRVRVLSGQWYIMALACVLGLLRFVGHMWIAALLLKYVRATIILEWRWLVTTSLSLDLNEDQNLSHWEHNFLRLVLQEDYNTHPSDTISTAQVFLMQQSPNDPYMMIFDYPSGRARILVDSKTHFAITEELRCIDDVEWEIAVSHARRSEGRTELHVVRIGNKKDPVAAVMAVNILRDVVENGGIETVHKSINRPKNGTGNAEERIFNYCWWKNKIDELLDRWSVARSIEIDNVLTVIVSDVLSGDAEVVGRCGDGV